MAGKKYGPAQDYETKLKRIMGRLNITEYDWNWDRHGGWVKFKYKGGWYIFEHSIARAQEKGEKLTYGSDAFAQVVLILEDLARMVDRGIYELQLWVSGMKYLPPVLELPTFFTYLGFTEFPQSREEVKDRYKNLAKSLHPDAGGETEDFLKLKSAVERALQWFEKTRT